MCPLCDETCDFWYYRTACGFSRVSLLFDFGGTVFFAAFMALWGLSIYPALYPSVYLSIQLSVCLSICLSIYPFVCLSIRLSVYLIIIIINKKYCDVSNNYQDQSSQNK